MADIKIPDDLQIPSRWQHLTLEGTTGTLMVIGAPDTGKSTFARYLYLRLGEFHERVGFIDGDMGQSTLGPPTTMTLVVGRADDGFPPPGPRHRFFIGDKSPRGHMLPTLVGVHKLVSRAKDLGATATILDTTGLVSRTQGGGALKRAKIDLLEPSVVFALQRQRELEHLLVPLRRSGRTRLVDLPVSDAVRPRDTSARRAHRRRMFRRYFEGCNTLEVDWTRLAVLPTPSFERGQLVALEAVDGLTQEIAIIFEKDSDSPILSLKTPASSLEGVDALRVGELRLDPSTYQET